MNPKTLQHLMGHSDIGVTMNVYTHSGLEEAAEDRTFVQNCMNKDNEPRQSKAL